VFKVTIQTNGETKDGDIVNMFYSFYKINLIMELKFPCKTFQQHFSRNGTNILKMVQIYEE
jgi:hypothetical protein